MNQLYVYIHLHFSGLFPVYFIIEHRVEVPVPHSRFLLVIYFRSVKCVRVAQSCPILCDSMDYIVHGILQARIPEWVAFAFSRDLPNPGIKPRSLTLQADSLPAEPQGKP